MKKTAFFFSALLLFLQAALPAVQAETAITATQDASIIYTDVTGDTENSFDAIIDILKGVSLHTGGLIDSQIIEGNNTCKKVLVRG